MRRAVSVKLKSFVFKLVSVFGPVYRGAISSRAKPLENIDLWKDEDESPSLEMGRGNRGIVYE